MEETEKKEDMIRCPNCGSLVKKDQPVCPYCGHVLHKKTAEQGPIRIRTSSSVKVISSENDEPEVENTVKLEKMPDPDIDMEKTQTSVYQTPSSAWKEPEKKPAEKAEKQEKAAERPAEEPPAEPHPLHSRPQLKKPVLYGCIGALVLVLIIAFAVTRSHQTSSADTSVGAAATAAADSTSPAAATADTASDEYILPESDQRLLTDEDVAGLTLQQLNYARNEIFARHGYIFSSDELNAYFATKSWYEGTVEGSDFDFSSLNTYEVQNAEFLLEKEKAMDPNGYQLDQQS